VIKIGVCQIPREGRMRTTKMPSTKPNDGITLNDERCRVVEI